MPPKASPASAWQGAPPVAEDGFAFANGDFFAEASGHNRHRRATPQELQTHFASGSDKDHPAHWFEAQLVHYGLQPSKTKSVARMRLFDAVNAGGLKVPAHVTKLEGKLKKEWTKNDREAKKAIKATTTAGTKNATTLATKRKATDDAGPAKKAKTAAPKATTPKAKAAPKATPKATSATPAPKAASTSKTTPAKKQTARRGAISQSAGRGASTSAASQAPAPRTKQTARRGNRGFSQASTRTESQAEPDSPPRKRQYARRSNAFMARGRIPAPDTSSWGLGEAPPPYSEFPEEDPYHGGYSDDDDNDDDDDDGYDDQAALAPLGLLNGSYRIECPYVTSNWDWHDPDEFDLTLTLAGSSLWGSFNLGVYEGVLYFEERPYDSSHDRLWFKWRGREDQGPIIYGNGNEGWIKFLGGGRVEGWLDHQSISFKGRHIPGQGTRSSIDARTMQNEWSGYSEAEYDRENRARWH